MLKNNILLSSIFILFFGFLLPAFFIYLSPGQISFNFFLSYFIVLLSTIRLGIIGANNKPQLTFMFFYVFVYVFLGVQPMLSAWANNYPHKELSLKSNIYTYSSLLVLLGVLAFEFGYRKINTDKKEKYINIKSDVSIINLFILIFTISLMVVISIFYYGLNIYLSFRDGVNFNDSDGPNMTVMERQLVIDSLRVIVAIVLFISLYVKKNQAKNLNKKAKISLHFLIIYLIVLNLLVSNPLNAARLWSGSVLLTSLFIIMEWRPRSFLIWSTVMISTLLLLFSGLDPRKVISQTMSRGDEVSISSIIQSVGEGVLSLPYDANFDAFQIIAYTEIYVQKNGYSFGNQLLLPMFFWVPRTYWKNKPLGTSDIVGENAGFYSVNVSSSLWTEGYVNFGVIGIFLFLFFFGRLAYITDSYFKSNKTNKLQSTIVASYFASNTFILLRGDLTTGTMYLQMIIVFTFLIKTLIIKNTKSNLLIQSTSKLK